MGRNATREEGLDKLLRGGRFVDLYRIVKNALIAGIERYSIKDLEVFYEFERQSQDGPSGGPSSLQRSKRACWPMRRIAELAPDRWAQDRGLLAEGDDSR